MPCFYCLDPHISISICLQCTAKLERARDDAERYRKDAEGWRNKYWNLVNEKKRVVARKMRGKR
jgi:hypothetical protein